MLATLEAPACTPKPVFEQPFQFKKKFRYTYAGTFGAIEWPEHYVKVVCPTDLERANGGSLELMAFEIDKTYRDLARRYQKMAILGEAPRGTAVVVKYDGCGNVVARYTLEEAVMDIDLHGDEEEYTDMALLVTFQSLY